MMMMMMRSTKKEFDQNSASQAACDTSIARVAGRFYPRKGYNRSVGPLLMPGLTGLHGKTFSLDLRAETVKPALSLRGTKQDIHA